jgi:hypothetical protein
VAGLLVWTDWIVLPYLAVAVVALAVACRHCRPAGGWRQPVLAVVAGAALGAAPLLAHNLAAPPEERSITVFVRQTSAPQSAAPPPVADRLHGGVVIGIPMATGLCAPSRCAPWQQAWFGPYLVLLLAATVLAFRDARRRRDPPVISVIRLGLPVAAALSIAAYARSPAAATTPVENVRYLSCLLISLPAVLWPLWTAGRAMRGRLARGDPGPGVRLRARVGLCAAAAPIVGLLATMLVATAALWGHLPEMADRRDRVRAPAQALLHAGVRHAVSDYATCNRLMFATRERVVCAVIRDDLRPGLNRYTPYRALVVAGDRPAFVVPVAGDVTSARVAAWLDGTGVAYTRTAAGEYHIYRPVRRVLPPGW